MANKMAARVSTYELGLSSYGDSKREKLKKLKKTIVYQSLSLVYDKRVFLDAAKNGTIFSNN